MTAPNFSFPQADAIIEQLTTRIHDLIGTDYRDAAIDAASRAEAAANRIGSAERVEGWVASVEASAKTASDAANAATSAVRVEVEKLTAGAPEAFDTLKEISDELEKNETERAALATTIGKKADTDYVDGHLAGSTRSGISLLPMAPGTNTPMWAASFREVTDDVPPGEKVAYSNNEDASSIAMEWPDGWVKVSPRQRYRIRIWLKADSPGSGIVFWGYGDNDSRGIEGNTVGTAGNYPVWVRDVPTEWTLYEGTFRIRDGVTAFRIGGTTWNHSSSENTEAVQFVSGFEIWPDFAPGEHEHLSADITDATTLLKSEDKSLVVKTGTDGHIHAGNHPTGYNHLARKGYVDGQVAKKADTAYVDTELGKKATKSEVSKKADTAYVDTELGKKATESEVSKKADTSYVDQELSKKADAETVSKRPALFHGYGPPGVIEGAVPGDKYWDTESSNVYVLKEENIG